MEINKDNLIEGIGDEVLIVISLLLITFIVFLLWLSKDLHCLPTYIRRLLNQNTSETIINEVETMETTEEVEIDDGELLKAELEMNKTDFTEKIHSEIFSGDESKEIQRNNCNDDDLPLGFIRIRLKYLDERITIINVDPQSSVIDFKRNNFHQELSNNKAVRLIYNGRELKDVNGESTLAGYGLTHNSTVHCLVTPRRDNINVVHSSTNESSTTDINLGNLMFPLFGFALSLLWYYRLNYKYHFNMMTTFALIGITGMYFVACFVNYSSPIINYREPANVTTENRSHDVRSL